MIRQHGIWKHQRKIAWLAVFLAMAGAALTWWIRTSYLPRGPYKVGFAQQIPYHFALPDGKPAGIIYDVVSEAAKRCGIELIWVYCLETSDEALGSGKVDLWPMMADLPERRKKFYISDPWIGADFLVLARKGTGQPNSSFRGVIGHTHGTVRSRMIHKSFPFAKTVVFDNQDALARDICLGKLVMGVLTIEEARLKLQTRLPECGMVELQAFAVPGMNLEFGVGANYPYRNVAARMLQEISILAREGLIFSAVTKYSMFGFNEITATYNLLRLEEQRRRLYWSIAVLSLGLVSTLALCWSLYRAKKALAIAGEQKAESVKRYVLASRATNDAMWDWDLRTGEVIWSELMESLFGYSQVDIEGTIEWRNERIHREDCETVAASIRDSLTGRKDTWSAEYRFRCGNGKYAYVMDRAQIVYGKDGESVRMIGAMSDLTPRRLLEEKLRQSQKMEAIGRLAGGVAHDFNNLLTVINGYSELLVEQTGGDAQVMDYAREIQKAGLSAASLTQQLLAFSRRQIIEPKIVDLNEILREADTMIHRLLGENIETVIVYNSKQGVVLADSGQLIQVIMNLAINARDAMPEGGKLIIEASSVELDADLVGHHAQVKRGSYELLAVSDTGIGMDEGTLSHIFEPFYTTKTKGRGTGMGLSIVYGIVRQSNGWIWVYSEPDKGTTFKIYLPRAKEPVHVSAASHAASAERHGVETVLLVEDQDEVRKLTSNVLGAAGYCVLPAANADEALILSGRHAGPIHLMLTDVVLPGLSGRDLAERMKLLRPQTRVLYMSGYTENVIAHRGILERGIFYLPKPFSPGALLDKVRQVLEADVS